MYPSVDVLCYSWQAALPTRRIDLNLFTFCRFLICKHALTKCGNYCEMGGKCNFFYLKVVSTGLLVAARRFEERSNFKTNIGSLASPLQHGASAESPAEPPSCVDDWRCCSQLPPLSPPPSASGFLKCHLEGCEMPLGLLPPPAAYAASAETDMLSLGA